ncbi:NfeD family protein [Paenibacillus hexagrammi]|uniref:Protease n=1 Tax=Paenibacillus hexagrammi TaxID=2908839 RepID=A0ABY3SIS9_9BACL|nr:NfeD family protein [Paenibacillus sp. YPD9-1]UJF33126.1 protease [Paenibacillus sp. YPD9-1]
MTELYWSCLAGGVLFAIVSVILGDVISHALDGIFDFLSLDVLKPMVLASAITGFGGAGILLGKYTAAGSWFVLLLSLLAALLIAVLVFFLYVRPMENSENSTGYSIHQLSGKIGEVTVPIPAKGYGEVMIRVGAGNTQHTAVSFERVEIPAGSKIVVVDVKNDALYVSSLQLN